MSKKFQVINNKPNFTGKHFFLGMLKYDSCGMVAPESLNSASLNVLKMADVKKNQNDVTHDLKKLAEISARIKELRLQKRSF